MKAVILCAGKGTRMQHLTADTPKPLLIYKDKTLIEHKLIALPDHIDDVVLVVGYLGESIRSYFGDVWHGGKEDAKKIHYVEQTEMLGTAHALLQAKHLLDEPFIVLMGDDLYGKEDLEILARSETQNNWAILVERSEHLQNGGKIVIDEQGNLKEIAEDKAGNIPYNFVYTGACLLTPEVFDIEMTILPGGKEHGLPQTFAKVASERPIKVKHATFWKRITTPEDLE